MMKTLYLMKEHGSYHDRERLPANAVLTRKAEEKAMEAGQRLKVRNIRPDLILAGNSEPSIEAASVIAAELDLPRADVEAHDHIFQGTDEELLNVMKEMDDSVNNLMVCGQESAFSTLVDEITGEEMQNLSQGAIACIQLDIDNWKDLGEHEGRVTFVIDPDDELPNTSSQDILKG